VRTRKASNDARPESYRIDRDSINIVEFIGPDDNWRKRKHLVEPLRAHCQCCLLKEWTVNHKPSLGFFRPKEILRLEIDETSSDWTEEELSKLRQELPSMFDDQHRPKRELEKIPFEFRYLFRCDEVDCGTHRMLCSDWE